MLRILFCGLMAFSVWLNPARDAIAVEEARVAIPDSCVAGEKVRLETSISRELPASSFYRINIECPVKPAGGEVAAETGYPASEIVFSVPGDYECEVEIGIITKSSCAGVQYSPLSKQSFKMTALENSVAGKR